MRKYEVFFEIYGKKMKTTVEAKSAEEAENIVKGKLIVHKAVPVHEPGSVPNSQSERLKETFDKMFDNVMDGLDDLIKGIGKKS